MSWWQEGEGSGKNLGLGWWRIVSDLGEVENNDVAVC